MFFRKSLPPVVLTIIILASSCIDESVTNIENTILFNPSYSLPIGPLVTPLDEVIPDLPASPIDSGMSDSIPLFSWKGQYYPRPEYPKIDSSYAYDLDLSSMAEKLSMVKSASFRLNIKNGYPTTVGLQVYLRGLYYVDSLFRDGFLEINAAALNAEGYVAEPYVQLKIDAPLNEEQISRLPDTRELVVRSILDVAGYDQPILILLPEYEFFSQFGLRVELEMSPTDL